MVISDVSSSTTHTYNHLQKLAAVVAGGLIYTSTDSGVTWTEQPSAGSRNWYSIASSSDGTVRRVCWGGASRKAYDANDDVAAARSRG